MIVHTLKQAEAALAAAEACNIHITLRTAPGAIRYMGLTFLKALFEEAKQTYPKVKHSIVLDCGFDAALAHRAMVMGFAQISFSGTKAMKIKLSKVGSQLGSKLVSPYTQLNTIDLSDSKQPKQTCILYIQQGVGEIEKNGGLEKND